MSRDKVEEAANKLLKDCGKRERVSRADVEYLKERKPPQTRAQKCLAACVGETIGLVRFIILTVKTVISKFICFSSQLRDRRTSIETAVKLAKSAVGVDDPRVAVARDVATECHSVTDEDRCEAAAKIYGCARNRAVEHGFKFEDL